MNAWNFSKGNWIEIPYPFEWKEGQEFREALEQGRFYNFPSETFGHEYGSKAEVYHKPDAEFPVIIEVTLFSEWSHTVIIDDFPSLMMFIRDYGQSFSIISLDSRSDEQLTAVRRAFYAWHNHEADTACQSCDPIEMSFRKRRKEKAQEAMRE